MSSEVKSMDLKKTERTVAAEQALTTKKVEGFISEIKSEVKKITWTTREELITYTKIVVLMTFTIGMAIYLLDLTIQGILGSLSAILRFITG